MTTTTKTGRPLTKKATARVNKLREKLAGTQANTRGVQRMQKNRASNILYGAALHATARLEAGYELSDLERTLVEGLGKAISPEETKEWGKAYGETQGARKKEFLPDIIAEWPLDKPFTLKDLADALPAQIQEVKAQPNVRVVDVARLAPGQGMDQRDEALRAAEREYGTSFVYYTSSAPQPKPAPAPSSAEARAGEVLGSSEFFVIQPFKMQTIKRSGDTALGPSDEIFWSMSAGSDNDKWTFRSREFGSCDDGDWDSFDPSNFAFLGPVSDSLALSIDCWEKDAGSIFDGISDFMFDVADRCMEACRKLQGDPETDAASWAALLSVTFALVGALLQLFNNEDDFVAGRNLGWDRAALLSLDGKEECFRFDGEAERGMGIQDLYLRFGTIPTGPVRIVSQKSNKDITIDAGSTANGAAVHQWEWSNVDHQKFYLNHTGLGYFAIKAAHSQKYLDVSDSSQSNEARVIQYPWQGSGNECLRLEPVGGQLFRIVAKHSGKVLNVRGASTSNGAEITQYEWRDVPQQKWKLVPA